MNDWIKEFPAGITVCNYEGVLLEMNDKAAKIFASDGGRELIGKNLRECHPELARLKVEKLISGKDRNIYTIEKNEVKKLIVQLPWYNEGEFAGFVELSIELPEEIPNFVRQLTSNQEGL
jgi:sensor histidine kinase regulating citrate/malate metabolism